MLLHTNPSPASYDYTGWGSESGDFKVNTESPVIDMCVL